MYNVYRSWDDPVLWIFSELEEGVLCKLLCRCDTKTAAIPSGSLKGSLCQIFWGEEELGGHEAVGCFSGGWYGGGWALMDACFLVLGSVV